MSLNLNNIKNKQKNMRFEDSKTKQNLKKALQGEALAHLKYQFYKSKLSNTSKQYEQAFDEIIHNEKKHGKIWFKKLHEGEIPYNKENLKDAIAGEQYEAFKMYLDFAEEADKEGFTDIAELFRSVAAIEAEHSEKFAEMLREIDSIQESKTPIEWKCLNCGHVYVGEEPPEICPVCNHLKQYFVKDF